MRVLWWQTNVRNESKGWLPSAEVGSRKGAPSTDHFPSGSRFEFELLNCKAQPCSCKKYYEARDWEM